MGILTLTLGIKKDIFVGMESDKEIRINLQEERKKIELQIETLNKDLQAIDRLMERYKNDEEKAIYTDGPLFETVKLSEAVKELFEKHALKEWKSREIIAIMEKQIKEGKVETNSQDIAVSTRSILKILAKKEEIEKMPVMGGMKYKKKI